MRYNTFPQFLDKFLKESFPKYKGVNIEKVPDGFMVFGRKYPNWKEATGEVDRAALLINNSIIHHE